ncbi:response regulator transcription factor [Candidatus Cyanaurora vandensis]|uniref:response regulator transcription factor n=1 Tax=Candidatus Cyanaurora vandensis TaxID=2714958 RepID=UPI00257A997B|nr:response regulator transcription factor [Candidatus Cyanaurora vandensis]
MAGLARKLLLVDDDSLFTSLMSDFLTDLGYGLVVGGDGVEGLALAKQHAPELLIADIMMPKMNGFELVQTLRADSRFQGLPIIMLSAKGETVDRIRGLHSGADAYLVKPFELDELTALLEALLRPRNLSKVAPRTIPSDSLASSENLTPTEHSVLQHLAVGMLNKEIAKKMCLSTRTVESHVHSMLQKTTLTNRTALARWAMEAQIV